MNIIIDVNREPPLSSIVPTPEERKATAAFIRETHELLDPSRTPDKPRRWQRVLHWVGHWISALGSLIGKAGGGSLLGPIGRI